jgi:PIN domain nuclease of toxin-antitoxin system
MARYVLDADGILAFLEDRPGATAIEELLKGSVESRTPILMSVVSWGSVYQVIFKVHGEVATDNKMRELKQLSIELIPADDAACIRAALISAQFNLPYINSFAAALAWQRKATLISTQSDLKLPTDIKVFIAK